MNDKETIYNRILESFNKQTFMGLIGAKLEYVEYGKVSVSCENRKDLSQQHGFLHGGVIMSIADICGRICCFKRFTEKLRSGYSRIKNKFASSCYV